MRIWPKARKKQPSIIAAGVLSIWRPKLVSNFRSLDQDDAALLDALADGRTFPELCEAVAPFTGEEQAPARAASLLRAWVEGGLIAGFSH